MSTPKRICLGAGGTGGHMFPAQALAEILTGQGWEVSLVTDVRGLKHAQNIPTVRQITVAAATISPSKPLKAPRGVYNLTRGVIQAKKHLASFKPDIVAGFGGYPAFPALMAARSAKIPFILHEQNAVLGRVNRVFAKKAEALVSGFDRLDKCPGGIEHLAYGNPLRAALHQAVSAYKKPTAKGRINLLIVGGSLGATLLSRGVPEAVAKLPEALRKRLNVVQQTREDSLAFAREAYAAAGVEAVCEPFFTNIAEHLAKAHLVISRAGASSVAELALMGRPSILVPLAIAMDDHQFGNAMALKEAGAADVIREADFNPQMLSSLLEAQLSDSTALAARAAAAKTVARPDAAQKLADLVIKTAGSH